MVIPGSLGTSFINVYALWLHNGICKLEAICLLNILPVLKTSEVILEKSFVYLLGSLPDCISGISLVCVSLHALLTCWVVWLFLQF